MILASRIRFARSLQHAIELSLTPEERTNFLTPMLPEACLHRLAPVTHGIFDFGTIADLGAESVGLPPDGPLPADPFERRFSDWWADRQIRSDVHVPADRRIDAMVSQYRLEQTTKDQVRKAAYQLLPPRPGLVSLFKKLKGRCVIDAGPSDSVEEYLRGHGLEADVAATVLVYDKECVIDYYADTPPIGERGYKAIQAFLGRRHASARETIVFYRQHFDPDILPNGSTETINVMVADRDSFARSRDPKLGQLWLKSTLVVFRDLLEEFATDMAASRL